MSTLPNVSAIYRDLNHLNQNLNHEQPKPNFNFSSNQPMKPQNNSFQDMYGYKQQRHNQLMDKLRKASQDNRMILEKSTGVPAQEKYQNYTQTNLEFGSDNYKKPFVMPKIRYRHIEDHQKEVPIESILQKQFYEDKNQDLGLQTKNQSLGMQTYEKPKIVEEDQQSEISGRGRRMNYQEKLDSYYELCRKNLKTEPTQKEDRFIRNEPKVQRFKLEEAMKILQIQ